MNPRILLLSAFAIMRCATCKIVVDKDTNLEFEWEIIAEFMRDQYTVTLFVEKNYEDYGDNLLKYSLQNYKFATFHYNNITLITQFWSKLQRIAMYTERIYGVVIIVRDLYMIDSIVKASANNKIVLVLFDLDDTYIKQLMGMFWDKYKTYKITTFSICTKGMNRLILQNPFQSIFFEYPISAIESCEKFVKQLNQQYKTFMSNMHGYPIRVYIFDFPIISMPILNQTGHVIGYTGMHGTMLKWAKQFMNFTPIFVRDFSGSGSMFGLASAKMIDDGKAEIGMNGRFVLNTKSTKQQTVYLYPITMIPFLFVVPINYELEPLEIFVYFYFDVTSRILIALSIIIATTIWLLGINYFKNNRESGTIAIPLKVIAILHCVSVKIPKKIFNQIIFVTIAFFGLLLTSVYQGMVVKELNTPFKPLQLNTLKDLLNSNLDIGVLTYAKQTENNSAVDANNLIVMGEIGRKTVIQYDSIKDGMDAVAYNKSTALLMPIIFLAPYAVKYFNTTTGLDLLHIIKEPSMLMLVTYVIARNSPYINVFNHITITVSETGIMHREVTKAGYFQKLLYMRRIKNGYIPEEEKRFRPIQIADVIMVKHMMVFCFTVAIIAFFCEHVVYYIMKCTGRRKN